MMFFILYFLSSALLRLPKHRLLWFVQSEGKAKKKIKMSKM